MENYFISENLSYDIVEENNYSCMESPKNGGLVDMMDHDYENGFDHQKVDQLQQYHKSFFSEEECDILDLGHNGSTDLPISDKFKSNPIEEEPHTYPMVAQE
jgi:hypothetical protein